MSAQKPRAFVISNESRQKLAALELKMPAAFPGLNTKFLDVPVIAKEIAEQKKK